MKFTLSAKELQTIAARFQGVVSDRVLATIGIKAISSENSVNFFATDRMIAVYSSITAPVDRDATFFISGRLFLDIIRQIPDSEALFSLNEDSQLIVEAATDRNQFKMKLPIIADQKWQDPPVNNQPLRMVLPSEPLSYAIKQVFVHLKEDRQKPFTSVVYMHKNGDKTLRLVGSDSVKLGYVDIDLGSPEVLTNLPENGVCLYILCIDQIQRLLKEGFEHFEQSLLANQTILKVSVPGYSVYTKLSNTIYPEYRNVIPQSFAGKVEIHRDQFCHALKLVLVAAGKTSFIKLSLTPEYIELHSRNQGISEGSQKLAYEKKVDIQPMVFQVNGSSLLEILSVFESEYFLFCFNSPQEAVCFIPSTQTKACSVVHVTMPASEQSL